MRRTWEEGWFSLTGLACSGWKPGQRRVKRKVSKVRPCGIRNLEGLSQSWKFVAFFYCILGRKSYKLLDLGLFLSRGCQI
jgi:hypothetical protein